MLISLYFSSSAKIWLFSGRLAIYSSFSQDLIGYLAGNLWLLSPPPRDSLARRLQSGRLRGTPWKGTPRRPAVAMAPSSAPIISLSKSLIYKIIHKTAPAKTIWGILLKILYINNFLTQNINGFDRLTLKHVTFSRPGAIMPPNAPPPSKFLTGGAYYA